MHLTYCEARTSCAIARSAPAVQLGDGHVIERGTHDELLAMPGGAYRGMWQRQLNEPEQPSAVAPSGSEEKQPLQAAGPMT